MPSLVFFAHPYAILLLWIACGMVVYDLMRVCSSFFSRSTITNWTFHGMHKLAFDFLIVCMIRVFVVILAIKLFFLLVGCCIDCFVRHSSRGAWWAKKILHECLFWFEFFSVYICLNYSSTIDCAAHCNKLIYYYWNNNKNILKSRKKWT